MSPAQDGGQIVPDAHVRPCVSPAEALAELGSRTMIAAVALRDEASENQSRILQLDRQHGCQGGSPPRNLLLTWMCRCPRCARGATTGTVQSEFGPGITSVTGGATSCCGCGTISNSCQTRP